jgi:hypothetical protein
MIKQPEYGMLGMDNIIHVAARGKKTYSVSYISICTSQNQALKDVS